MLLDSLARWSFIKGSILLSCSKLAAARVMPLRHTELGHRNQTESASKPLCSSETPGLDAQLLAKVSPVFPFF